MSVDNAIKLALAKAGCSEDRPPNSAESWKTLLSAVEELIEGERERRQAVERTLAISANETTRLIEQLKIASKATLAQSESTFRTLFDRSPTPHFFFKESGVLDCNWAAIEILGAQSKADILGKHPRYFSPEVQPDGRTSLEKSIEMDAIATRKGFHQFEWMHRRLDQTLFLVEVTLVPVYLNGQRVISVHWRDLTDERNAKQSLVNSAKMASLGEMAGGMAHEINSPLAILSTSVSLIRSKIQESVVDTGYILQRLDRMELTVDRIAKIIRGLRTFSRESGGDPMSEVEIGKIIEDTLDLCHERFKLKQLDIRLKGPLETCVLCRSVEISQIALNLLNNACDAVSGLSERWVEIEVVVNGPGKGVSISFTDSGGGIPQDVASKIMTPFFTTKRIGEGTGLGLSISVGIAEAHGGKLWYDSSSRHTRFVLELPSVPLVHHQKTG